MNEQKYLIITYSKEKWIDQTKNIKSLIPYEKGFKIKFFNNNTTYSYKHDNIQVYEKPTIIDHERYQISVNGRTTGQNISLALKFNKHICLFEGTNKKYYDLNKVSMVKNASRTTKAKNIISYYAQIAEPRDANDPKHLQLYYSRISDFLSDESFAARFIDRRAPAKFSQDMPLIFPFGVNLSQKKALQQALQNQLSLIQGPPGTGKTQTILNLIANLIMQGKTIAVAAGNNSAVSNIQEKLDTKGLGFLAASLGSKINVETFFKGKKSKPDMKGWHISAREEKEIRQELVRLDSLITQLLDARNQQAKKEAFLDKLERENRYFQNSFSATPFGLEQLSLLRKWQTPEILDFMADFESVSLLGRLSWKTKLKWLFKYRIYKFKKLPDLNDKIFRQIVSEYYQTKIQETSASIDKLKQELVNTDFDKLLARQSDLSMRLFKGFLAKQYKQEPNEELTAQNYKSSKYQEFIEQYPVTLSTTDSLIANKPTTSLFDYLIVDEASQVSLVTAFLAMSCARNLVVVGDTKQLPHIANNIDIEHSFGPNSPYDFKSNSLLDCLIQLFPHSPTTLLREHYRCHPAIIEFCNQKYYNGELIVMTHKNTKPFKIIQTEKGNHAATPSPSKHNSKPSGYVNQREIDVIEKEILPEELTLNTPENIGIITPYKSQRDKHAAKMKARKIDIDTVHKFQGREKNTIIFSTTANKITRFNDTAELINVTVSRAKDRFILLSSQNIIKEQGTNIGDLIRYIEYQSEAPAITTSSTVSIFDCLYGEYSEKLNRFKNKVKPSSKYLSQDLMSTLIQDLLQSGEYSSLTYQKDYSLNLLIRDIDGLSEREAQFIQHPASHVDFLIYNKMDMLPVLAIEVDGYQFHDLNPQQLERDAIKDNIFKAKKLPLVRFSTKGSDEKERLIKLLSPWKDISKSSTRMI